ncbi:sensor histidine kinase [Flavobacterium sp. 3HN19-14]|uniref:sensor histidine kinase n=1 Tax=Flavobacterium sp. 3HN19-14 TaxID=3448133 RepID=UPI003EDF11C2
MEGTKEIETVFWIGTTVMLFFAFGLIFLVMFYQNHFSKIKRKEAELLLKASLESEKNERHRIAADLHDSVSSDLSAIRNYLVILHNSEIDQERKELFHELRDGVETAIENTRMVSYNLIPPLLEISGLAATIDDYFERLRKKTEIDFQLKSIGDPVHFPSQIAYELFRVIQEFITNMLKYGAITKCTVTISCENKKVQIAVEDNGKSYNFKNLLTTSKGTGLKNINSRVKVVEAELIQKETTKGNHFLIVLKEQPC